MVYRKREKPPTPEEIREQKREWWRRFRESRPRRKPPVRRNDRFGWLKVFEVYLSTNGRYRAKAECICGNVVDVRPSYLKSYKVKSCGCMQRERAPEFYEYNLKRQRA